MTDVFGDGRPIGTGPKVRALVDKRHFDLQGVDRRSGKRCEVHRRYGVPA